MTLAELREHLARRAGEAAAMHATAPVADVLGVVLAELKAVLAPRAALGRGAAKAHRKRCKALRAPICAREGLR